MLIRAPGYHLLRRPLPLGNISRYACASARATTLYFRAKIPPPVGPDHVEIVCKASCARRPFLFSRLSPLPLPLLSPCYPFRPSTLVIYRGYAADARGGICTTRDKKKKRRRKRRRRGEGARLPEDPQYYRFASIIRPRPPSPLREQKK
jgi:hypothetical protein